MKVEVLGVKIDDISLTEAVAKVEQWIQNSGKHYIVTPNPEFLVAASKDGIFREILNNADLAIPDGAGLKLSGKIKNTTYGVDLMEKLIALAVEKGFTIGLLGGREGVAEKLSECLKRRYKNVPVVFADSGGEVDGSGRWKENTFVKIPLCDILFVAFGHGKQEKWIAANLNKVPVNVMMGVGGAFDEVSGMVPRCPVWVQKLGLKWLFRLMLQPWRIKRHLALIEYLWLLVKDRLGLGGNLIKDN